MTVPHHDFVGFFQFAIARSQFFLLRGADTQVGPFLTHYTSKEANVESMRKQKAKDLTDANSSGKKTNNK